MTPVVRAQVAPISDEDLNYTPSFSTVSIGKVYMQKGTFKLISISHRNCSVANIYKKFKLDKLILLKAM